MSPGLSFVAAIFTACTVMASDPSADSLARKVREHLRSIDPLEFSGDLPSGGSHWDGGSSGGVVVFPFDPEQSIMVHTILLGTNQMVNFGGTLKLGEGGVLTFTVSDDVDLSGGNLDPVAGSIRLRTIAPSIPSKTDPVSTVSEAKPETFPQVLPIIEVQEAMEEGPQLIVTSLEPVVEVLTKVARLANGSFQLTGAGNVGVQYAVEASSDLDTWVNLGLAVNQLGAVTFDDADAKFHARRYYRLKQQ